MTPDEEKEAATRREALKGRPEAMPAARTPRTETDQTNETNETNETGRTATGKAEAAAVRGDERSRGSREAATGRDIPDRATGSGGRGTASRTPFSTASPQTAAPSGATADERETPDRAAPTPGERAATPRTPVPLGSREAATSREARNARDVGDAREATASRDAMTSRDTAPRTGRDSRDAGTRAAARAADTAREASRNGAHGTNGAAAVRERGSSGADDTTLLSHDACDTYASRMRHAVGGFVDGPRASVEEADHVLEELTAQFTDAMAQRRRTLRTSWEKAGADESSDTEQLRLALRDYREVTERLLHL